jgi:hypothetical protein
VYAFKQDEWELVGRFDKERVARAVEKVWKDNGFNVRTEGF